MYFDLFAKAQREIKYTVIENATKKTKKVSKVSKNVSKTRWVYCFESVDAVYWGYAQIPKTIGEVFTANGFEPKGKARVMTSK